MRMQSTAEAIHMKWKVGKQVVGYLEVELDKLYYLMVHQEFRTQVLGGWCCWNQMVGTNW